MKGMHLVGAIVVTVIATLAVAAVVASRLSRVGMPDKVINSGPGGLLPELIGANVQIL